MSRFLTYLFIVTCVIHCITASCHRYRCCPPWLLQNSSCYLFIPNMKKSFLEAETFCQNYSTSQRSAHLVSVTSEEENLFLKSYVAKVLGPRYLPYYLWIGYNDIEVSGTFVWTDGATGSYQNFAEDEQPNAYPNEDCVALNNLQKWRDLQCRYQYEFVCKKPAGFY
ncbi:alpha-N-acetylgalactosamine-specific lectin-like [Asterias amurensis]|uniref:alpha-N-acetylgalactosamine-specific lectin-like n=1 Tax=Asterias amurensis TaxID=7602 RepID=UPI003AB234EE